MYALHVDNSRIERILSEELFSQWSVIEDSKNYTVEISVSCSGTISPPTLPKMRDNESDSNYEKRVQEKKTEYEMKIDALKMEREGQIERIVSDYNGEILTSFIECSESFTVTLRLSGLGLRDLALNYSYIFEVSLVPDVSVVVASDNTQKSTGNLTILAPSQNSPIVCVIDSGIQENHKYIALAILQAESATLIPDGSSVTDEVKHGGHGTRVAGAVLYPHGIPESGEYQLPYFIRNIKIMGVDNKIPDNLSCMDVIDKAIELFVSDAQVKTKIFNHSIGERKPFAELKHMSSWASKIDEVSYKHDVLFIQAAGNIHQNAIIEYVKLGYAYHEYFEKPNSQLSQIANPAQSLQAITVGSISHSDFETEDAVAMEKNGEISSFSRIGPGIWDSIKPDV